MFNVPNGICGIASYLSWIACSGIELPCVTLQVESTKGGVYANLTPNLPCVR